MGRRFDLVIFDCDGVLVDSEPISVGTLAEQLTAHGLPTTLDEAYARYLGRTFVTVLADYERRTGRPAPEGFAADYKAALFAAFRARLQPMPGVEAVLAAMTVPICVATSSMPERAQLTLSLSGLDRFFGDRVFTASMAKRGKPAPDLFLLAAEKIGVGPARSLVIEDSVIGVEAAKAAGMTAWRFLGGSHWARTAPGEGAAEPDATFYTMAALGSALRDGGASVKDSSG
jgi:HAD superfamily hydrolase (TIGR01509 family)